MHAIRRKSALILLACLASVVAADSLRYGWRGPLAAAGIGGLFLFFAGIGGAIGAGMMPSREQASPGGLYRGGNIGVILVAVIFVSNNLKRGGMAMLVNALWPR